MNPNLLEKAASPAVEEQRLTLSGVTWEQYEILRTTLDDFAGLRMTYLKGTLELFMPSPEHENIKKTRLNWCFGELKSRRGILLGCQQV